MYNHAGGGNAFPNNTPTRPPPNMLGMADATNLSPVDAYLRQHEVTATGDNVPAPFISFEATGFPPEILREIHLAGFSSPTPIQAQTCPIAMQSRDIVAIAKTGSCKTLGYLMPSFMHLRKRRNRTQNGPTVLVLPPTRELATQIQDEAVKFGRSSRVICSVGYFDPYRRLEQILRSQERGSRVIIFCATKRTCDQLARSIGRSFGAAAIHGDKSQGERDYVLNQFRSGKSPILVATDVAARGLDIKDIRVVVNYDFPTGIEDYVHPYTFFCDQDRKYAADLVKLLEGADQQVPSEVRNMAGGGSEFWQCTPRDESGISDGRSRGRSYSRSYSPSPDRIRRRKSQSRSRSRSCRWTRSHSRSRSRSRNRYPDRIEKSNGENTK
ncbi:hypothetical protein MKW98_013469 [Papaver atlanticum]|uniref:RNA helicase n=1 Tax=Papaver atlanticum TaxID=357466 RepID=A0AAD4SSZ3_9MAGN|nr:hypothetical protein MKW98_013469 [Papaver atlanticum]